MFLEVVRSSAQEMALKEQLPAVQGVLLMDVERAKRY